MKRLRLAAAAALLGAGLTAWGLAAAAGIGPDPRAELRRGLAAAGDAASDEPALRRERQTREPSPAFALGAALGAWTNARAALDYDLHNPSGDGDDSAAIAIDCFDERTAFAHLEARRRALDLTPPAVLAAAGPSGVAAESAWRGRQAGPPPGCR